MRATKRLRMDEDIETRVLQLFEVRLQRSDEISAVTRAALLKDQGDSDFGDDERILQQAYQERTDER